MKEIDGSRLHNEDLAPVPAAGRSWGKWLIAALTLAIAVNVPGFLAQVSGGAIAAPAFLVQLYSHAWFVSLMVAGLVHFILSRIFPAAPQSEMT